MTERIKITLFEPVQAHKVLTQQIWPLIKASLMAGHRMVVEVRKETRSLEQNALLHAALTDIANQVEWYGKKFDVVVWKRLCVASWLREKNQTPDLIPALDGNGFDVVYEKTSKLSVTQCSELLEWCFAFGAEHGVKFRAVEADY